jgi:hypothetical protein
MVTNGSGGLFGNRGFVMFRKGGDGSAYLPRQTNQQTLLGSVTTNSAWP